MDYFAKYLTGFIDSCPVIDKNIVIGLAATFAYLWVLVHVVNAYAVVLTVIAYKRKFLVVLVGCEQYHLVTIVRALLQQEYDIGNALPLVVIIKDGVVKVEGDEQGAVRSYFTAQPLHLIIMAKWCPNHFFSFLNDSTILSSRLLRTSLSVQSFSSFPSSNTVFRQPCCSSSRLTISLA